MPIVPGSRYQDSPVITVTVREKTAQVITPGAQQPFQISYFWHTLAQSESLDSLAQANYSDPSQWYRIADANPEVMDWLLIQPGTLIRIPVIPS